MVFNNKKNNNENNNENNDLIKIAALLIHAAKIDENQILEFTKKVKNMSEQKKIDIIKILWKIIYSNKDADIYETNLMRRLGGLMYIDNKLMGDIKEKIKKENMQ